MTAHASCDDSCPPEEDVAAFVGGCLAAAQRSAFEAHVAGCDACRRLLSALARAAGSEPSGADNSVAPTLPLASRTSDAELPPGARFGRYVVLDWLGAGGMGVVYSVYDPDLNRKVALKVLRNDGVDRLPSRDLLLAEAQAMAKLAHPNVVTVFEVGSVDGRVFLAMELIEGQTLSGWLRARRRKPSEILAMFVAAGNGLAAAHAAGLIHRDFKPDNVLVGNDGRVRVTDFGLARTAPREPDSANRDPSEPIATGASQTGLAGTPAYMAPEQYLRRSADARADQFSFAVALYEALCGERPFASLPGSGAPAVVATPRRSGVPAALRQVLLRALRPDPDERYPSITELLAALTPPPRRARSLAVATVVVVSAAMAAAGGYAVHLRRRATEEHLGLVSRIELVTRLRSLAPEFRTVLRTAHMLPGHDIRPARDRIRNTVREVEREQQTPAAQGETAVIAFVLGEAFRALGDRERALALLDQAWAAGERGPQIDAALGDMLGASYWNQLEQIDSTVPSSEREDRIRAIEQHYRDPAMTHLRAALAAGTSSPAYLEALIAFHDHHFDDAIRSAHSAWAESPTLYEAGMVEARAHHEAGRALLAADRGDAARQEFVVARQVFDRVLEIARSDDDAWLGYGEMLYVQARDLGNSRDLPPDLRQQAIDALRTVRQINPDRWDAILSEVEIYEHEANLAIMSYRDPRPHVDRVLAMAEEARVHGAATARVEMFVCRAYWERAVYDSAHGTDPRADFARAVAACERAVAAKPDPDNHSSLGVVYATRAIYESEHGGDPAQFFDLGERSFRAALAISDEAVQHYNLGRLWSSRAHYQTNHGDDPRGSVNAARAEFDQALRLDATRCDALAAIGDVLVARARFEQAEHENPRQTIADAREALRRALAIDAALVPPIRYRIELGELEAEALLADHADPGATVTAMRADAQQLLLRRPEDGFAHLMSCRAELLAARSAIARGAASDAFLARAAAEAAHARAADPMDASAWTACAEVEQLRASEAARSHRATSAAEVARGLAFIEQAMKIDPRLIQARRVRDELARQAQAFGLDAARRAVGP